MKNTILSAKGLCKSFAHNGGQLHIIQHINLDLFEGDFTVIMGASGSGKSTLLYSLSGMDRATSGEVLYHCKSKSGKSNNIDTTNLVTAKENDLAKLRHTDFGFIFQQMHLVSNLTLFENIAVCVFKSGRIGNKGERTDKQADGQNGNFTYQNTSSYTGFRR